MRNRNRALAGLGLLTAAILAACSGDNATAPDCDAIAAALVSRIEVQPATTTVNIGDSLQMHALAFSCAGQLGEVGGFQWRSSDATIVSVSSTGQLKAMKSGVVSIYAAAKGKEGAATVTAQLPPVSGVTVEPVSAALGLGRTSTLTARAFDSHGRELIGRTTTWSSADDGVVAVNSAGAITGVSVGGPIDVTATIEGKSATARIRVVLVPVNTVVVTPATDTIPAGATVQLTATLKDDLNNVLTGRAVHWGSSDPTIASVSGADGLVTGIKPGTVTITALSEGKSGSAQITVTLGAPARLVFIQQPSAVQAGSAISPPVTVMILDGGGNPVPTATSSVTLALTTPGGAVLGGTFPVNAVNGIATFSDLTVSAAGNYSLTAASSGLTGATSAAFQVTRRPALRLGFVQQPASAIAGSSMDTVTVELQDETGARVAGPATQLTLAIGANPGGGTLSGTLTHTTSNGLATFVGLRINRSGTGYTLAASASGLTGAVSDAFDISAGPATKLAFIVQPCPNGCPTGVALTPAPQVALMDGLGNRVTSSTATSSVTVALTAPGGAVLGGTIPVNAVNGIATFSDLTVSAAGSYALTATSPGLAGATSAAFQVTLHPIARLAFVRQPASTVAGSLIDTVTVELQDEAGTRVTGPATQITLAIGTNPGGGTLGGTLIHTTSNGLATFVGLRINRSGTGYTLAASAGGLTGAVSDAFDISAGPATKLAFIVQPCPAECRTGVALTPAPQVAVEDGLGNTVTSSTATVSMTLTGGQGQNSLTGTKSVQAVAGIATFPDLKISQPATGLSLHAASGALASAVSAAFTVTNTAPILIFSAQPPPSVVAGVTLPAVQIRLQDGLGGNLTVAGVPVTIALGPSGTVVGTLTRATDLNGVATFDDLMLDSRAGTGFAFAATATGYTTAVSDAFAITVGVPAKLTFKQQPPATVTAGDPVSPPVSVQLRDAGGHVVRQGGVMITLTVSGGGTLKNDSATTDINGAAVFNGLKVNATPGAGYTLTAQSGALSVTSNPFEVVH